MELKAKRDATTVTEHAGIAEEEEGRRRRKRRGGEAQGVLLSSMMGWKMSTNRDREGACPG